ncbi:uncharacterized protein LOC129947839 [Eupeodes corollae]|uniref:uncharacterized protein LOC129947839 n=1 Tax=Eupeodes corollae TaxID=290404 RepID=UPI002493576B|nr:uncharacterized protein LOC129947839 [Eupeodes corollae]
MNFRIYFTVVVIAAVCFLGTSNQVQERTKNSTHDWAKSRQKRFLIFQTQATHKFLISLALNIDLHDKTAWRSLSGAWNFQWQHMLPLKVIHWWNSTYFPVKSRSMSSETTSLPLSLPGPEEPKDLTATFLYAMIENYMNNKGMNGRECLQRAICENAQVHFVGGVLDHVYKRLLTPERSMEGYYKDSFVMGLKGADCLKTFYGCPKGKSVFDHFVRVEDVNDVDLE